VRLVDRQAAAHLAEEALEHTAMAPVMQGMAAASTEEFFCLLRFNLQLATKVYALYMAFEV